MLATQFTDDLIQATTGTAGHVPPRDDLSRLVYCVLGVPIDAIDMPRLVRAVEDAALSKTKLFISTINLNYLISSHRDPRFRKAVLLSDVCAADGAPIVWIARLLNLPIRTRVAGSDMFEAIKVRPQPARQLKFFVFGGPEGVGQAAANALNKQATGWRCVGSIFPGFGDIEEMSADGIIDTINRSKADFLLVALGAVKGQLWLLRNHQRLQVPVRAHLGATINFAAGKIRRAPSTFRRWNLEWLWRIKEEPRLWRRYCGDGVALIGLLFNSILPLILQASGDALLGRRRGELTLNRSEDGTTTTLQLLGMATEQNIEKVISIYREAMNTQKTIRTDLSGTRVLDARFLGLFLVLWKTAKERGLEVEFIGASARLKTMFRRNRVGFLLGCGESD
jgi:N-acetylglucosaminyldiphosphoundecaprenol N-acetyl-beta-D-mannosaminyltransferase